MPWKSCSRAGFRHQPSRGRAKDQGIFGVVEDSREGTFRTACTVRFPKAVYVLHCFQKKAPSGIRTAGTDVKLIRARLKLARADYEVRYGRQSKKP